MRPALITGAIGVLLVIASLGQFIQEHPFDDWVELAKPAVLFVFLGHIGTTLVAWFLRSPQDAVRGFTRRRNDAPNGRGHESRRGG